VLLWLALGALATIVAIEWRAGRASYTPATTLSSLASGAGAALVGLVLPHAAVYELVQGTFSWRLPADSVLTWLFAAVALDFVSYWAHRAYHTVPILWAMHSVHHQPHEFNLATGVRAPWLLPLMYAPFVALLALLGVPASVMGPVFALLQVCKLLQHSAWKGDLGPLEYLLCTPRRHAVHHRQDPQDQHGNFGGLLLVWDQLFGTLTEPRGEPRYGLGARLPDDPLHNNLHPWRELGRSVARRGLRALLW
jgi:sterol desaturase/sphingolipid hydroxylase (fatty acid hydroxylase superfamily)